MFKVKYSPWFKNDDSCSKILQIKVEKVILMRILSIFILTIHATKDIEAHHKPGYSKYVADDESKVKVRNSDNQNINVSEAYVRSQT